MSKEIVNYKRFFQMWQYTVGHSQLLLRSVKRDDFVTRVDVLFKNVSVIQLPTTFDALSISELSEGEEISHILPDFRHEKGKKNFVVRGSQSQVVGYVIAGALAFHEDDLEYHDPSHFWSTSGIGAGAPVNP